MLATLEERENGTNKKIGQLEIVLNDRYAIHHNLTQRNLLVVNIYENRIGIHRRWRADSVEVAMSRPKCEKGCSGRPGECNLSLGSITILDFSN